jgi:hypothetical protein
VELWGAGAAGEGDGETDGEPGRVGDADAEVVSTTGEGEAPCSGGDRVHATIPATVTNAVSTLAIVGATFMTVSVHIASIRRTSSDNRLITTARVVTQPERLRPDRTAKRAA